VSQLQSNIIIMHRIENCGKLQRHNYKGISLLCTGYKIVANCSVTIIEELCTGYKIVANYSVTITEQYHYYAQDRKLWQIAVSQL